MAVCLIVLRRQIVGIEPEICPLSHSYPMGQYRAYILDYNRHITVEILLIILDISHL